MPVSFAITYSIELSMNVYLAKALPAALLVGLTAAAPLPTKRADADFLTPLAGRWTGGGDVLLRTNRSPLKVDCDIEVAAEEPSFTLEGECGALFIKRPIGVTLEREGERYSGVYTGSRSGPADLAGTRDGDSISLTVTWAREVNGDVTAAMKLVKESDDSLRLLTEDLDPETGETVVTSDIALARAE